MFLLFFPGTGAVNLSYLSSRSWMAGLLVAGLAVDCCKGSGAFCKGEKGKIPVFLKPAIMTGTVREESKELQINLGRSSFWMNLVGLSVRYRWMVADRDFLKGPNTVTEDLRVHV